jgi:predicted nucleic acid-binding protein
MMRVLVDTNVVARLLPRVGATTHLVATNAVTRLRDEQNELFVVPQIIYEYWVVATRPVEQNGFGFTPAEAAQDIVHLKRLFTLLRDERSIFDHWEQLAISCQVAGKAAHDTRLVAAMKRHSLSHLLTFNPSDFKRYHTIQLLDPVSLVASA